MSIQHILLSVCSVFLLAVSGSVHAELYARYNSSGNCDARMGANLSSAGGYLANVGPNKKSRLRVQCALNLPANILDTRKISTVRISVLDGSNKGKVKAQICVKKWTDEKVKCGSLKTTNKSGRGAMFLDLKMPGGNYNSDWIVFVSVDLPKAKTGLNGIGHMSVYLIDPVVSNRSGSSNTRKVKPVSANRVLKRLP